MNWEPTILVVLIYLAILVIVIGGHRLLDHTIGIEELKKRSTLILLAATGNDYRQPRMDPGMFTHQTHDAPGTADDPVTAILVRSSEAERRWYALHYLLDRWETELKHQMVLQPDAEQAISRFLFYQFREATEEAKSKIQKRIQMHTYRNHDEVAECYIIEDPRTGYKQRDQMADVDLVRFDAGGEFPPPVQQRIDTFPNALLRDVEQRSDTLETRV